jgi:phosphatidylinositol dimannoside acyltransferase
MSMGNMFSWRRIKRRVGFRVGFGVAYVLAWVVSLFGMRAVRRTGRVMGSLHHAFDRRSRRDLTGQLERALDHAVPIPPVLRDAYRINDGALFEILAMYVRPLSADDLRAHCHVDHIDRLRSAISLNRGVVLLGMHMGNGMLMVARLAADGLPISVVYRESNKMPDGFFERLNQQQSMESIHVEEPAIAYRQMRRALARKRIVFILMDQGSRERGVELCFLGKRLTMPAGPVELARRTGAPILAALPLDDRPDWHFEITPPLEHDGTLTPDELTKKITRLMEQHIRRYPRLWTWHHRRWRRHPFETDTVEV